MSNLYEIYGKNADIKKYAERINNLKSEYTNIYNSECEDVFSSSGRIEILGNHTDHNRGSVLVGAINQDIIAVCGKRDDNLAVIQSKGFGGIVVNINDIEKNEKEKGTSAALVKGVIKGLKNKGCKIGGITALLQSNVFKGAGVSSSAAYEVLLCKIFDYYYCGGISPLDAAKISQYAESEYFGKPCGLLDQCGIAFGGVNHIDFADTENPVVTSINPQLGGYGIVITNCGGDHSNLTPEYAAVKNDMNAISAFFGKKYLRELPEKDFYNNIAELKNQVGGRAILRAIHFYDENARVDKAAKALTNGDIKTFLSCVNLSGESSYKLLQNCFAQGDKVQGIPLALELSKKYLKGKGAVRVHGGGFAGTIIAFVPLELCGGYISYLKGIFGGENVIQADLRSSGTAKVEI